MWNNHKDMNFQVKSIKCTGWKRHSGLKQAPRAWYSRIDSYLTENGFHGSESELKLYTKVNEQGKMLIVYLYVNDLILTGDFGIADFKVVMESEFEMTNLGLMKLFSGIDVQQYESDIFI